MFVVLLGIANSKVLHAQNQIRIEGTKNLIKF